MISFEPLTIPPFFEICDSCEFASFAVESLDRRPLWTSPAAADEEVYGEKAAHSLRLWSASGIAGVSAVSSWLSGSQTNTGCCPQSDRQRCAALCDDFGNRLCRRRRPAA